MELSNAPNIVGVFSELAKVNLSLVGTNSEQQDNTLRVVSWHLQPYMTTKLLRGTFDADILLKNYPNDTFQLLELLGNDKIWKNDVHEDLQRFGNPVFLRNLIQFSTSSEADAGLVQKGFNAIIGNTLLVDNIDDAKELMLAITYGSFDLETDPPPILTRDGARYTFDNVTLVELSEWAPEWKDLPFRMKIYDPAE